MILLLALFLIMLGIAAGPEFSEHAATWIGFFGGVVLGSWGMTKLWVWLFVGSSKE